MKLENQVCSIEQAEELKRLGLAQRSLFHYVNNWLNPRKLPVDNGQIIVMGTEKHQYNLRAKERDTSIEFVSAFNVAELGELLGRHIEIVQYSENKGDFYMYWDSLGRFETEAQARAFVLIESIKEGVITIEDVNKKLNSDIVSNSEEF